MIMEQAHGDAAALDLSLPHGAQPDLMAPGSMDSHSDAHGQAGLMVESHGGHGAVAPPVMVLPLIEDTTAAVPLHGNRCVGDLITGPNPWSRLLVLDHLDPSSRLALFRTCTTAKDMLLVTAKRATIHLEVIGRYIMARLQAADRAMLMRGGNLRTKLEIRATDSVQVSYTLGVLARATATLDELSVQSNQALPTTLLPTVAFACPTLRALQLHSQLHELPSPELFPLLRELTIHTEYNHLQFGQHELECLLRFVAPYMSQLTLFSLPEFFSPRTTTLEMLLSPAHPGTHLHTLHLNAVLNDTLLGLILQSAPAVQHLSVNGIQLQSAAHAHTQHQWRRLEFRRLYVRSLARLPLARGMELVCGRQRGSVSLTADAISEEEAGLSRLAEHGVRFTMAADTLCMDRGPDIDDGDQPAAFRVALSLVRLWPLPTPATQARATPATQARPTSATQSSPTPPTQSTPTPPTQSTPTPATQSSPTPPTQLNMIKMSDWIISAELMQELQVLPHWGALEMDMFATAWPEEVESVWPFLSQLPDSFRLVCIWVGGMPTQQVESICLGAPCDRTPDTPLRIELRECAAWLIKAIHQCMSRQDYAFSNVVVVSGDS